MILENKLVDIEHAYFCYLENCPICDGLNARLDKDYGKHSPKLELTAENRKARVGEIWSLDIGSSYPIYVLLLENYKFYFRAIRASEFIDFKSNLDIIHNNWLLECWNSFPVLRERLEYKIETLDKNIFNKVLEKTKELELLDTGKNLDQIIARFHQIELDYQNKVFLDEDEPRLIERETSSKKLFRRRKKNEQE